MRITFHEDADAELTEAARYYEERAPGLGFSFLGVVETAVAEVRTNPEAFTIAGEDR